MTNWINVQELLGFLLQENSDLLLQEDLYPILLEGSPSTWSAISESSTSWSNASEPSTTWTNLNES